MLKDLLIDEYTLKTLLPISHITTLDCAESIVKCGFLNCEKSNENCICLFYGPPLYKVKSPHSDAHTMGLAFGRPIGLIFSNDLVDCAHQIFPFDSGAYQEHFRSFFPESFDLDRFAISPVKKEVLGKLVHFLYGSNENYIFGQPANFNKSLNPITEGLFELYNSKVIRKFDERCHGIEIQFINNILLKNNVELIILPRIVYSKNKDSLGDIFKDYALDFYEDGYRYDPEKDSHLIQAKAREYFIKSYNLT